MPLNRLLELIDLNFRTDLGSFLGVVNICGLCCEPFSTALSSGTLENLLEMSGTLADRVNGVIGAFSGEFSVNLSVISLSLSVSVSVSVSLSQLTLLPLLSSNSDRLLLSNSFTASNCSSKIFSSRAMFLTWKLTYTLAMLAK